jgi:hypothetical protein
MKNKEKIKRFIFLFFIKMILNKVEFSVFKNTQIPDTGSIPQDRKQKD